MDPTALAPVVTAEDFSLLALFVRADLIVKIVMGILAFASIWSWAVAIDKWFTVGGAKSRAKRLENAFWSGQPMEDVDGRVTEKSSEAMARVFAAGAREWREGRRGGARINRKRSLSARARRWTLR